MGTATDHKLELRIRRHKRVRRKVAGSAARPRLAVFRSNKHVIAQVIDARTGRALAAASSVEKDIRSAGPTGNRSTSSTVGRLVAERAKAAGVTTVVFDRGGFLEGPAGIADQDAERGADRVEFTSEFTADVPGCPGDK